VVDLLHGVDLAELGGPSRPGRCTARLYTVGAAVDPGRAEWCRSGRGGLVEAGDVGVEEQEVLLLLDEDLGALVEFLGRVVVEAIVLRRRVAVAEGQLLPGTELKRRSVRLTPVRLEQTLQDLAKHAVMILQI
jgi:hypothetical protein